VRVEAPDGKVIEFPESMSSQDVNAAMGKLYPSPEKVKEMLAPMAKGSFAEDIKNFPASVLKDPRTQMLAIPMGGQAAGMAAKAGPALLQKAAPLLGRLATAAGLKSGEAATQGQSPLGGAMQGLAGEAVGEAIPPVLSRAAGVVARPLVTRAAKASQEGSQAAREAFHTALADAIEKVKANAVARGVKQALPELESAGDSLFEMVRGGRGKAAMDKVFQSALSAAEARLGGRKLSIPGLSETPMTLNEAVTALQSSGRGIGQQVGLARSETARQATMRYGEARDALIGTLKKMDPGAAQIMDAALTRYRQGRGVLAALDKSFDKSGNLDTSKLLATVNKGAEKLMRQAGAKFPEIESALTGGQKIPVAIPKTPQFVKEPFEPRGRLETILKGPQAPSVTIGGRTFPTVAPKGTEAVTGAAGGAFPTATLGTGAGLMDWLQSFNPFVEHRGPFSSHHREGS
jgi:hypothetical protein